eukprot:jgi/Bigna1/75695/fgenesh1_pg.36_\
MAPARRRAAQCLLPLSLFIIAFPPSQIRKLKGKIGSCERDSAPQDPSSSTESYSSLGFGGAILSNSAAGNDDDANSDDITDEEDEEDERQKLAIINSDTERARCDEPSGDGVYNRSGVICSYQPGDINATLAGKSPNGFYHVLGVSKYATSSQLRSAWLRLAKVVHPDRYAKETAEVKKLAHTDFKSLMVIKKTLLDSAEYSSSFTLTSLLITSTLPPHYGDPKAGCESDEIAVQIQGVQGDFCTPACSLVKKVPQLDERMHAKPLTMDEIEAHTQRYKGSREEYKDLRGLYNRFQVDPNPIAIKTQPTCSDMCNLCKQSTHQTRHTQPGELHLGNMSMVLMYLPCSTNEDVPRFLNHLHHHIISGTLQNFSASLRGSSRAFLPKKSAEAIIPYLGIRDNLPCIITSTSGAKQSRSRSTSAARRRTSQDESTLVSEIMRRQVYTYSWGARRCKNSKEHLGGKRKKSANSKNVPKQAERRREWPRFLEYLAHKHGGGQHRNWVSHAEESKDIDWTSSEAHSRSRRSGIGKVKDGTERSSRAKSSG